MVEPPPNEKFAALTGGDGISCRLRANGTFLCYPDIEGINEQDLESLPEPAETERFKVIDLGGWSFCAIRTDGSPTCWHWHMTGKMFTRNERDPATSDITSISTRSFRACGIRSDKDGVCWWTGGWDQPPTWPSDLGLVHEIVDNSYHFCTMQADGSRRCWAELPDDSRR